MTMTSHKQNFEKRRDEHQNNTLVDDVDIVKYSKCFNKTYVTLNREQKNEFIATYIEMSQKFFSLTSVDHTKIFNDLGIIFNPYEKPETETPASFEKNNDLFVDLTSEDLTNQEEKLLNKVEKYKNTKDKNETVAPGKVSDIGNNKNEGIANINSMSTTSEVEIDTTQAVFDNIHNNDINTDLHCATSKSFNGNLKPSAQITEAIKNSKTSELESIIQVSGLSAHNNPSNSMSSRTSLETMQEKFPEEPKANDIEMSVAYTRKNKTLGRETIDNFPNKKIKLNTEGLQNTNDKLDIGGKLDTSSKQAVVINRLTRGRRNTQWHGAPPKKQLKK